jgi:hypothetical protein
MQYLVSATNTIITRDGVPCRLWEGRSEGLLPCTLISPSLLCDAALKRAVESRGWAQLAGVLVSDSPTVMRQHGGAWEVWRADLGDAREAALLVEAVIVGDVTLPEAKHQRN